MTGTRAPSLLRAAVVAASLFVAKDGIAASKEECIDAHGRGQDLRDRGQLARARQTFLTCAQSSCPSVVQADCARLAEDLAQLVPTVTFSARDASAGDLPVTSVYVDDVLVTSRLDDGRSYEVDPGKHVVRYVHEGRETALKVVLNQGEKGRLLVATFVDRSASKHDDHADVPAPESSRSMLPLFVAGLGAAAVVTGSVLYAAGSSNVPDSCSMATKECAAPPGDPVLAEAGAGVRLANTGIGIGVAGAITLLGGLVWYLVQPSSAAAPADSRRALTFPTTIRF